MNKLLSTTLQHIGPLLCACMLLAACDNRTVVVPASDTTSPTIVMVVHYTTSDGKKESVELRSNSEPKSVKLSPTQPFAASASATDEDGGVMGIEVGGFMDVFCGDNEVGTKVDFPPRVSDIGGPGDTVPVHKITVFIYNPMNDCPDGNSVSGGHIWAYAENYHSLSAETAAFYFSFNP